MTVIGLLVYLVVAALAGAIAQAIAGYSHGGCLASLILGFIGALFGRWLSVQFALPEPLPITVQGQPFPFVWAVIGAALFVAFLGLFRRGR